MRTDILTEALCGVGVVKCEIVARPSMQGHHDLRVAPPTLDIIRRVAAMLG